MKIRLHLKDPDGVYDAISEAVREASQGLRGELSAQEYDDLRERREEVVAADLEPWVEYGEYVSVEIDTETGASRVLRRGE